MVAEPVFAQMLRPSFFRRERGIQTTILDRKVTKGFKNHANDRRGGL
jgi:hypothetical protein